MTKNEEMQQKLAISKQCSEHRIRCLYTSVSLLIWLKTLRLLRVVLIIAPIIFGAFAAWDLLTVSHHLSWLTSLCSLLAGIVPAIYTALEMDKHIPTAQKLAGEYKNLEIIFSDLEKIGVTMPLGEYKLKFDNSKIRLENANAHSYSAPEWCFKKAQEKINSGDYSFDE